MPRWAPALLFSVAACNARGTAPAPARDAGPVARVADAAPVDEAIEPEVVPDAGLAADPKQRITDGRGLVEKQKWAEAIAAFEAAGDDPDALQELAYAAALAGDAPRAERAASAILALKGVDDAHRATAYYHLGRAAELRGDVDAARDAYQRSVALRANGTVSDRLARLAPKRPPPRPPAPPCAKPMPSADLCQCLSAAVAPDGPAMKCIVSHRHGGGFWALTLVGRDVAPTFLVSTPAKSQAQAVAALGDADLTIARWNVLHGAQSVVRIDLRTAPHRVDAIVCQGGADARCLATFPLEEKVGTPAVTRRLDLAVDATEAAGVARLTVVEGPATPGDLLGEHRLW